MCGTYATQPHCGQRAAAIPWAERLEHAVGLARPNGGTMVAVEAPQGSPEHLNVGSHDAGYGHDTTSQMGSDRPSRMSYDGVFVYGMYQKQPFRKGLRFRDLGSDEVVTMPQVQGNLQFTDCARATVLAGCTYEGSVVVDGRGPGRDGLLGFQTRLATLCTHGLYLRDNQSIVMSDFYLEQADNGFVRGRIGGLPDGRPSREPRSTSPSGRRTPEGTAGHAATAAGYSITPVLIEPVAVRLRQVGLPFDLTCWRTVLPHAPGA